MIHPPEPGATWPQSGYAISSRGQWLPGIYDSERTARWAFRFPTETLQAISDRVCAGEQRPITADDLRKAKAGTAA